MRWRRRGWALGLLAMGVGGWATAVGAQPAPPEPAPTEDPAAQAKEGAALAEDTAAPTDDAAAPTGDEPAAAEGVPAPDGPPPAQAQPSGGSAPVPDPVSAGAPPLTPATPPTESAVAPDAAGAPPAVFSGSTTTLLEWRDDNRNGRGDDDHFGDGIMRTNFALDAGDTRASMRIDGAGFVSRPGGGGRRDDLRIERVALELDRDLLPSGELRGEFTVGDFYALFGHGLALSLRRVDEIGLDTALRGARADVFVLDDAVSVTLLGGVTNPVNIEAARLRFTDDPGDPLAGARIEGRAEDLVLGAHVAGVRQEVVADGAPHPQTINYGVTADLTPGEFAVALEADGQERDLGTRNARGLAIYGSTTAHAGAVTVLAEGKHFAQFDTLYGSAATYLDDRFAYSAPPTAERIDQELLDNTDVTGGRLRADLTTSPTTASSVHANAALFRNRLLDLWFAHAYGGVDQRWAGGESLLLSGGYRREVHSDDGALFRAIAHGELDALLPLSGSLAVHFIAQHQVHLEQLGTRSLVFHRSSGSLELDIATQWVLAYGMDLDTQDRRDEIRQVFAFGTLRWRPSDSWFAQVLAGSQRGGIRCIAGACRDIPPFSGVRLETTLRY